jgi:predicted AlkP superfamily pyrophosphatase or phosphodiesterase
MRNKVIFILCDGLRHDMAADQLGYIEALCHHGQGHRWTGYSDSPSVSKTNYETIVTGMPSLHHGFVSNLVQGKSQMKHNVFSEVKKHKGITACVGSNWFYDLYGKGAPFQSRKHKEINDKNEIIQIGRYTSAEEVSSQDLLETSDHIIHKYHPDFLLIHVQSIDHIGHTKGIGKEYNQDIEGLDELLGIYLPQWLKTYTVIIGADHGMDPYESHGGATCDTMHIPVYILDKHFRRNPYFKHLLSKKYLHQTEMARIITEIMGIKSFGLYQDKVFQKIKYKPIMECRTYLKKSQSKSRSKSKKLRKK